MHNLSVTRKVNKQSAIPITTKKATKKATIHPDKLKSARQLAMDSNYDLLKDTGASLVTLKGKKDPAWKFFKSLQKGGTEIVADKIVCELCYKQGATTYYSKSTSLSTLKAHLENIHEKECKNPKMLNVKGIVHGDVGLLCENRRDELVTRTSLMFIMTNTSFHVASNPYFKDWLLKLKVIKSVDDAPSERALSETGLQRLYCQCKFEMVEQLKKSPQYIAMIFDCWMDTSKRHFFAVIVRFLTKEFEQIELVLAFKMLEYKTANQERDILEEAIVDFQITDKKFIAISDNGSDMMKLCRLKAMPRIGCLAHALHNLINADVLPKMNLVKGFLKKLRAIMSTFRYRTNDLKTDLKIDNDLEKAQWLKKICDIGMLKHLVFIQIILNLHSNV